MNPPAGGGQGPVLLLLAAGEGRRFGGVKQLAELAGMPMCRRVAGQLLTLGRPLVVVTGAHADLVERALQGLLLECVRNAEWRQGMGRSIACGARHVLQAHGESTGVLLCLADQPLLDTVHLRSMLERHRQAPGRLLGSGHDGVTGPPVLFPADCLADLPACSGDHGARALLERESARLDVMDVPGHVDVDTPEDLARVRGLLGGRHRTDR